MLKRYTTISIDEVVERTKMQLRLQNTTEHDDYLTVLVHEGLRKLNNLYQLEKFTCKLTVEDNKAELPKNFIRLLAITADCFPMLYADLDFIKDCGCDTTDLQWYRNTFQITGKYIHLKSDTEVEEIRLAYYGLAVDDNGCMAVYEDFEPALMHYSCWLFGLAYPEDYPLNWLETHRRNWVAQKAYLKGMAQVEDFQRNKREIQTIFKSKLVSNLLNI